MARLANEKRIRVVRYVREAPETTYVRSRDLPRLLPLVGAELDAETIDGHRKLVELLRRALRAERVRAHMRSWVYDPARHAALARATRAEITALRRREKKSP